VHSKPANIVNRQKFPKLLLSYFKYHFLINPNISQKNDKNQLNLAIQALNNNPKLKVYTVSKIYKVDHYKLGKRLYSIPSRYTTLANSQKIIDLKEIVLIEYILDLAAKGFPLRLYIIEDIANCIIVIRDRECVRL
jgi:hypothetical protein